MCTHEAAVAAEDTTRYNELGLISLTYKLCDNFSKTFSNEKQCASEIK